MSEDAQEEIQDQSSLHKYRTEIPNLVFELGLDPYALCLYLYYKKVAGDRGSCFQKRKTIMDATQMSLSVIKERNRLLSEPFKELGGKPLIQIQYRKDKNGNNLPNLITITDIWPDNFKILSTRFSDDPPSAVRKPTLGRQKTPEEEPIQEEPKKNRRRTAQDTHSEELDSLRSDDDDSASQERNANREDLPEGLSDQDQRDILLKCPDKERLRNAVSYATNGNLKPENLAALIISNYKKSFKPSQRKNKRAVDQRHREEKKSRQKRNMELFEEMLKDKPFKAKFVICSSTVDPEVKFVQCPDNEPVGFATDRFYQTIEKKIEKEEKNFTKKSKGDIL